MFLPIAIHFWLSIVMRPKASTSPTEHKTQGRTLSRVFFIILVTICISTVTIITYSATNARLLKNPTSDDKVILSDQDTKLKEILKRLGKIEATNDDISRQIKSLSSEALKNQDNQKSLEILGTSYPNQNDKTSTSSGLLEIISSQKVNVYLNSTSTSEIIGKAIYNQIYTYNKKIPGWYQIVLPDLKVGWIRAQFVKEI